MDKVNPEFNREAMPPQGQEAGPEFYEHAQTRQWKTEAEKHELADKAKDILKTSPKENNILSENDKTEVSNVTYEFIKRFEMSKSLAESIAIMNEVLSATQEGKIPPDEAIELINKQDKTA